MESNERSIVPRRVAGVTAGLAGTGAILGAGLSAGLVAAAGVVVRLSGVAISGASSVVSAAGIGAALGAVLTPMTALSLLRQVALGKALLFTMLGMAIGVTAGELATGQMVVAAASGFGAFLVTAVLLRLTAGGKRRGTAKRDSQDQD